MNPTVKFTHHAWEQCAKRNLTEDGLLYVIRHGRTVRRAGTVMYFLGRRDIPQGDCNDNWVNRLEGVAVQTKQLDDGTVLILTAYHNSETGLKDHRRKSRYNRGSSRPMRLQ